MKVCNYTNNGVLCSKIIKSHEYTCEEHFNDTLRSVKENTEYNTYNDLHEELWMLIIEHTDIYSLKSLSLVSKARDTQVRKSLATQAIYAMNTKMEFFNRQMNRIPAAMENKYMLTEAEDPNCKIRNAPDSYTYGPYGTPKITYFYHKYAMIEPNDIYYRNGQIFCPRTNAVTPRMDVSISGERVPIIIKLDSINILYKMLNATSRLSGWKLHYLGRNRDKLMDNVIHILQEQNI